MKLSLTLSRVNGHIGRVVSEMAVSEVNITLSICGEYHLWMAQSLLSMKGSDEIDEPD